jgi:hypothetical protein
MQFVLGKTEHEWSKRSEKQDKRATVGAQCQLFHCWNVKTGD